MSISFFIKICVERRHSKIFKLLKPMYSYASFLASLDQFDKKLGKQFPANIYLFKVRIVTLI